uniref:Uncharacterized protein n=1 Tax=Setaria italica TaxID=4555 RepID=K4AMZ8_SETIT
MLPFCSLISSVPRLRASIICTSYFPHIYRSLKSILISLATTFWVRIVGLYFAK